MIAHHVSTAGVLVELAVIALVAAALAVIWWRGKRRSGEGRTAPMRPGDGPPE